MGGSVVRTVVKTAEPEGGGGREPVMIFLRPEWNKGAPKYPGQHGRAFVNAYKISNCISSSTVTPVNQQTSPDTSSLNSAENEFRTDSRWWLNPRTVPSSPMRVEMPVFVRMGPKLWQYEGHFVAIADISVTGEQWAAFDMKVLIYICSIQLMVPSS